MTINLDDPAYLGGYLAENFQATRDYLALTTAELHQLSRNGLQAAFLPAEAKTTLLAEVDHLMATVGSAIDA